MRKQLIATIVGLFVLTVSGVAFADFVGNRDSKTFHTEQCSVVKQMKADNKVTFKTAADALKEGYTACKKCSPADLVFIGNKDSKTYHTAQCPIGSRIKAENVAKFSSKEEAEKAGYKACSKCLGGKA